MKYNTRVSFLLFSIFLLLLSCKENQDDIPTIGFVDAFEDSTIEQAKDGFLNALAAAGFSEENNTIHLIYRNAQGDIPTLTQIVKYFIAQEVNLIASSPSLSTVTAVQNTKSIPIFMIVTPTPELMEVQDAQGNDPPNLYGVAENLGYIDSSFSLIPRLLSPRADRLRVGLLYNQSEPQSVSAYDRLFALAKRLGIELVARPVNTTADVQLVTGALLNEDIDAFFANPDNTVFGSFETILKSCNEGGVPIFTSEAGLVQRGAVAAYGADIYEWGVQAGQQAAKFLAGEPIENLHWEMVELRKRVYNPEAAQKFNINIPTNYAAIR